ncbi:hypothetical protein BCR34DRAFT_643961 [Clohesyomyces aquaticus]|uniref:Uncharacterized protein n=1 Tax=Clohesyomyces aquaticus TaxID=1231657 RepID=A0A1Y1ZYR3_9PLEO|nr:hypothetical protein BCR34DRAFT_643961 [Clohesyomyces aquaticus]
MPFLMQYAIIKKSLSNARVQKSEVASTDIENCKVTTWVTMYRSNLWTLDQVQADAEYRTPVVLVVSDNVAVLDNLDANSESWDDMNLKEKPSYIFLSLLDILANWYVVCRLARLELARKNSQIFGDLVGLSVLERTRALHLDVSHLLALNEDLRLHVQAAGKFLSILTDTSSKLCGQLVFDSTETEVARLWTIYRQTFNTEMIRQGETVTWLNYLAFLFLPLSYVVTLFGMTDFSVSAFWYSVGHA